jgi:putative membrane protein
MRTPLALVTALAVSGFALGVQAQSDGNSRGFIEQAVRGDNAEMMLGKLAANRAADPAVRDYGRMLYDDHARGRDRAVAVAHELGAAVTDRADGGAMAERDKLEETYGRPFDREFLRYMIADHRQDIEAYRDQAQRGGPAGRLAADTLPDLQKHLEMAEHLNAER